MEVALWIDTPALGDTIAAIPTLRKLSEAYGNVPLTVFTTKPFLFENHPLVKQAFKSDADKSDYIIYRTFSPLVGKQYDQHGTKIEFRYSNMDFRQFHAVSLGFTLQRHEMEMDLYIEKERELEFKDYVIIHPTHTWASRTWEREKWQELINQLNANGIPVVAVGRDSKEVGFFNTDKPVMDIDIKLGVNLLNDPTNDPAELRWMMNHRARAVVTMDSGMLHVAGTTDVNIIQLGSSIDNKLRAPYRGPNTSQDYKYFYVNGGCDVFCASNMKSNVQVHGSIQGVPPQVNCLESRPTFECHPSVDQVFNEVMKLYNVKGKVKLVHLLLEDDIDPQRQEKSIQSLSRLSNMGVEYIQVWNKRWTEEPPRENFTRPEMFDEVPITPGHYGAFRAFADGAIEHFTEDVDHFIMCEGDALLTVPPLEAVDQINKAIDGIKENNISYFSFGSRYSLEDNILQSHTREQHGDIHVVSNIIGIQMIMFPNNIREYLIDRFKYATWDGADIFLTDIFVNKFKMGMLENSITTQASGVSAIEERSRSFDSNETKKLVYLAPHLSTGGMPEFLLKRIEALLDQDEFEVHVIEFCLYADTYVVQRNKIKDLLGDKFYEIAHLGSITQEEREAKLISILEDINPDVIHIEECPESFDSFNKMSYETQASLYATHRPWKIVETCHNIWFDPKDGKRISPDAYAFVTPHHRLETFSEEPSDGQEILFPIIEQEKSETQRRKNLEIFGFDADADQYHLINIGLWTPGKNQGEAVEWARQLEAVQPGKFQFHFIGNQASNFAQYWEPIMEDLPANCHIHGERSDVETFYQIADAVVFNSTWECNPLTVRQSLGWPIPVMARNLSQYHEMYQGLLTEITGDSAEDLLRLQRMLIKPKTYLVKDSMKRFKKEHLELYMNTINGPQKRSQSGNVATITWDSGPKVTSQVGRAIEVDFLVDGKSIYKKTLEGVNHWCKPSIQYWQNWTVMIDGVAHSINNSDTQIIQFDSSSLGDTLSWLEPCIEFKKLHHIEKLYIASHKNWLFDEEHYNNLGVYFIKPGEWPKDAVALWRVGVYMEDVGGIVHFTDKNPRDWRKIYLGDIASDILGVYQTMRAPKLTYSGTHTQDKPYICIATASTAQAKYWNNPDGWQELINHYNKKGYDVYHISKEETHLKGLKNAPEGLDKVYKLLQGAETFYGISSGLTWFAWATDVPIVLISGFTPAICEFQDERTLRIINEDVCNSCWFRHHFDRGDWNWCPDHKGTERMFECTKTITAESVIKQVEAWQK